MKQSLAKEFGDGFRIVESEHWLIVTDSPASSTAETATVLERTHDIFTREWPGFRPKASKEPLVCICFSTAEGLSGYREKLGIGAPDGRGFYSLLTKRIVLSDEDKEPEGMVRTTRRRKSETRRHARTAHEAAHQLAFHYGVQIDGRAYPAWFAEGLAGNYEPETPTSPFGLTATRRPDRFEVISILRKNDDLIPLADFVGMPHDRNIAHISQVLYPQAAAFFHFLVTEYPNEFKAYQKALASLRIKSASKSVLTKAFTKAFGKVESLEAPWEQYLDRLDSGGSLATRKRATKPRRRGVF